MNVKQIEEFVKSKLLAEVTDKTNYQEWFKGTDVLKFLQESISDDVPVYISGNSLYVYSVFVSQELLKDNYVQDMLEWNFSPSGGWGYGVSYPCNIKKPYLELLPPIDDAGCKTLQNAEPILFLREFEGYKPFSTYLELNQRFAHLSGIHWIDSRKAYCKINNEGDIDEIVTAKRTDRDIIWTVKRDALDFYMFLTKTVMVRVFDVTRGYDYVNLSETNRTENIISNTNYEIHARNILIVGNSMQTEAGILRGFQIIHNKKTYDEMICANERRDNREYATFIAHDWKHKKVCECSCDPSKLGNYFVKSDFPFETSPAFFKPEVLSKYKQDPDKYTVDQRSISCRGSWYLKNYDINEAGQVHTYLIYLGQLPYKEQLYWKSFNEPPKTSISKRAYTTDLVLIPISLQKLV